MKPAAVLDEAEEEAVAAGPAGGRGRPENRGGIDVAGAGPRRPAVVGIDHLDVAVRRGEVRVGDVHPAVEGTRGVVVDPRRFAVVVGAAMSAGADRPRASVRRRPDTEASAAAATGKIDDDP